jgi:hypothetical protein
MEQLYQPHSKPVRLFFFYSGVVATLAYRIIIVLNNLNAFWVKISWYVGTIGFIIYFWHRFEISNKRNRLIQELKLQEKIEGLNSLGENEKSALTYILKSLTISTEKINYIIIFATSALALLYGIWTDFF